MLVLHAAVGAEAPKRTHDVRAVQSALNRTPVIGGGTTELLALDGICGPKTIAAIARFQLTCFGWTDFRIDPGMGTARMLNGAPVRPRTPQDPPSVPAGASPRRATDAPLGWIRWLQGDVRVNAVPAVNGQPLYRGDRVGTLAGGRALVRFPEGDEVQMSENTLIVMLGRAPNRVDAGTPMETHLETGRLREHLQRLSGGG